MELRPNTDAHPPGSPLPPAKAAAKLSGVTKVAALLLTMDKRLASRLLKHFDEDDIKLIAQTASDLGSVSKAVLDELIEEFARQLKSGGDLMATADEVEELLTGVVAPEQISEIMSQVRSKSLQSIWVRLSETPEGILARYLTKEHPQVAALVLSRAAPSYAAGVLRLLPGPMRNEVMRRMLSMKLIQERPLKLLEEAFKEDLLYNTRNSGPTIHARLADIINKMDRKHMDEVLRDLEQHRPKEAEIVRSLLFTFDDIAKLNQAAMLALFDQVPPERTIAALTGADPRLRELILEAVPARARRMIEQEIATGKKPLTKEISKARRAIADLALDLMEKGVIELNAEDEEAEA
jgi:flagellar motor switch protein FliG